MTTYTPIIQYCQERIKTLTAGHETCLKMLNQGDILGPAILDNFHKGITKELFDIIRLCEQMDHNEALIMETLKIRKDCEI